MLLEKHETGSRQNNVEKCGKKQTAAKHDGKIEEKHSPDIKKWE